MVPCRASGPDLGRLEVIDAVVQHVASPPHKVDIKGAEVFVSVQITRSLAMLGLAPRWRDFRKYNLRAAAEEAAGDGGGAAAGARGGGGERGGEGGAGEASAEKL
ncbi:unnamed protein product [Pedinophyceae sp. YPF-701]|nr:unnamed protein product [Pedinophyceae sp. YPF-701]